jgi:hypothetical protein
MKFSGFLWKDIGLKGNSNYEPQESCDNARYLYSPSEELVKSAGLEDNDSFERGWRDEHSIAI